MTTARRSTLILGATGELGTELARRMVGLSDTLYLHGHEPDRTAALAAALAGGDDRCRVVPLAADFTSLRAARDLVDRGLRPVGALDVLINAVDFTPPASRTTTEDGNEVTWQVNYLAPAQVALSALPLLRRSPAGRLVHLVRDQQRNAIPKSADVSGSRRYYPAWSYTECKLALMMLSQTMAVRLRDSSCRSVAMQPAGVDGGAGALALSRGLMVDAVLYACTSQAVPNGAYLHGRRVHQLPRAAAGPAAQQRMWRATCRALGLDPLTGEPPDRPGVHDVDRAEHWAAGMCVSSG
jgi:NAD(P)-dependent dehydrogenase (short-subunit alcohol dehydrogenase family)